MVDFEDTEEGMVLLQRIATAARREQDCAQEMEDEGVYRQDLTVNNWLLALDALREITSEYRHKHKEYNDNNKHYILNEFKELDGELDDQ